jgi:hypothetical protein
MIFDSSKLGNTLAFMIQAYPVQGTTTSNPLSAYRSRVVIGLGSQPTPSQLQTNWSTEYYLNDTGNTGTAGNSILCGYGDLWVDSSVTDFIWERSAGNLYANAVTPQSYYFKDGIANWAVIWFNESLSMSSNSFPSDNFMIVPVSDISGSGVVKLSTTTVNSSAPTLSSVNLSIGGGV